MNINKFFMLMIVGAAGTGVMVSGLPDNKIVGTGVGTSNGFNDINGFDKLNGHRAVNGNTHQNGVEKLNGSPYYNGVEKLNGSSNQNGVEKLNGSSNQNGVEKLNGSYVKNGAKDQNGLTSGKAYMNRSALLFDGLGRRALSAGPRLKSNTFSLTATTLSQSASGRKQLKYLISCALPAGTTVQTISKGKTYEFKGSVALAPEWQNRPLNTSQERWVSACILSRTNYFGKKVLVFMSADNSPNAKLAAEPELVKRKSMIHEGAFYGNLFTENPVAFVCEGKRSAKESQNPIFTDRICALPKSSLSDGRIKTHCNMIYQGPCETDRSAYKETIDIHLYPR